MKIIKVLGSGCQKCNKTAELIKTLAEKEQVAVDLVKETRPEIIMQYGVMSTPAVVVDEKVVHTGSIPHTDQVLEWLK